MDIESILSAVMQSGNGQTVNQLSKQFGVSSEQAKNAVNGLLPALTRSLARGASTSDGLGSLLGALSSGNHQEYFDNPQKLEQEATVNDGNGILGHLFGSKDVSRNVAGHVAEQTGIDSGTLRKMLPVVAALAMGALSKKARSSGMLGSQEQNLNPTQGSLLTKFLDQDGDGSVVDDVLGMARRFF